MARRRQVTAKHRRKPLREKQVSAKPLLLASDRTKHATKAHINFGSTAIIPTWHQEIETA